MIRGYDPVRAFELALLRGSPPDLAENLRVYEAMWRHARDLGRFPLEDPLEGIENDIRLAAMLNVRRTPD